METQAMLKKLLGDWLLETEAASALNKTVRTLQSWRAQGKGPAWTKNGNTVLYHRDALHAHLKANEVRPPRNK
jgi:Helix-turn-helix domain